MKSYFFSAVAIALLASCSGSEIDEAIDNGQPVAINLSAGVQATTVVSRAPVTGSGKFKATVLAWEGAVAPSDYTEATKWTAVTSDINATGSTSNLTLTDTQYYSADEAVSTYMKAFYAESAAVNATDKYIYNFANTDGAIDVLIAPMVSGNRITPAGAFAFTHPLMQLKFKLVAGAGFPDGVTITSMTIKDAKLPIGVNMSTDAIIYANAAGLLVPNAANSTIPSETAGNPVMVEPFAAPGFKMDIVTNKKTYTDIPVTLSGANGGVAYTVTLTFKESISASASVTDWDTTGTGSGDVE